MQVLKWATIAEEIHVLLPAKDIKSILFSNKTWSLCSMYQEFMRGFSTCNLIIYFEKKKSLFLKIQERIRIYLFSDWIIEEYISYICNIEKKLTKILNV